jgi:anti-sigma-K factor RskA
MNDGPPHELSAAYALDALDGHEREAYETHLAGCERCRGDVASFRATASALAYDVDLPPLPETLEHRIVSAARAERPNVVPLRQRIVLPAAALSAVAAVAAIAIGIWAIHHLSNSLDHQKSIRKDQKALIDILSDCAKTPTQGGSGAVCVAPTEKAVLIADSLPAASPNKTYEAWVIAGKRVQPAGLFRGGAGRKYVLLTKPVRAGTQVAVTLEKRGGVSAPTTAILLHAEVKPS